MGNFLEAQRERKDLCFESLNAYVSCVERHQGQAPDPYETEWCLEEQAARRNGTAPKKRHSICDCQTACGLFAKQPVLPEDSPPLPTSLFDHLCDIGAPTITVKGREARQIGRAHV